MLIGDGAMSVRCIDLRNRVKRFFSRAVKTASRLRILISGHFFLPNELCQAKLPLDIRLLLEKEIAKFEQLHNDHTVNVNNQQCSC